MSTATEAKIPEWLGHLRTDRRGIPVPYINRWGAESTEHTSIRYDENVRMPAVFVDDTSGPPDFTRQHMARQRECVMAGKCQVCARFVPFSRRTLVVAALSVEQIRLEGKLVTVIYEPWLCQRCAYFAINRCPALIRRERDEKLQLIRVRSERQVRATISTGWVEGPLEEESRKVMPAMWAKIQLLDPIIEFA